METEKHYFIKLKTGIAITNDKEIWQLFNSFQLLSNTGVKELRAELSELPVSAMVTKKILVCSVILEDIERYIDTVALIATN